MSKVNRIRLTLLIAFVALALTVRIYAVTMWESDVLLWLHDESSDSNDHFMLALNAIGGPKPVLILSIVFAVAAFVNKLKFEAIAVPIAVGLSGALNVALRAVLHRHRPELWQTLIYDHSFVWSFPSGHACLAASLATAIGLALWKTKFRKVSIYVGMIYCAIIAMTSITLGVHYPLDILGGWLSGTLVVSIIWSILERFQAASATEILRED